MAKVFTYTRGYRGVMPSGIELCSLNGGYELGFLLGDEEGRWNRPLKDRWVPLLAGLAVGVEANVAMRATFYKGKKAGNRPLAFVAYDSSDDTDSYVVIRSAAPMELLGQGFAWIIKETAQVKSQDGTIALHGVIQVSGNRVALAFGPDREDVIYRDRHGILWVGSYSDYQAQVGETATNLDDLLGDLANTYGRRKPK